MVAVLMGQDKGVDRSEVDTERCGIVLEDALVRSRVEQDSMPAKLDQG